MLSYQEYNDYCSTLNGAHHVVQWGGAHVWKVYDKVFAVGGWGDDKNPAITFKTSELNFEILKDEPGFRPAPYLASRGFKWIQHFEEPYLPAPKIKEFIYDSYLLVASGLSKKNQREIGIA